MMLATMAYVGICAKRTFCCVFWQIKVSLREKNLWVNYAIIVCF